jgi:hypothetical protein
MARTVPRPRWRQKNVLDIPLYRPGHFTQPREAGVKERYGDATPTTTRHRLITQTPTLCTKDKPAEREQDCAALIRGFPSDKFIFGRIVRAARDSVKSRDLLSSASPKNASRN